MAQLVYKTIDWSKNLTALHVSLHSCTSLICTSLLLLLSFSLPLSNSFLFLRKTLFSSLIAQTKLETIKSKILIAPLLC